MSVPKTPSRLGSALSVVTAVVAVGLVATDGGQRLATGVAVLAAVALAVGLWWRDQPLLTILFVPAGVALLAVGVAIGFLQSSSPGGAARLCCRAQAGRDTLISPSWTSVPSSC